MYIYFLSCPGHDPMNKPACLNKWSLVFVLTNCLLLSFCEPSMLIAGGVIKHVVVNRKSEQVYIETCLLLSELHDWSILFSKSGVFSPQLVSVNGLRRQFNALTRNELECVGNSFLKDYDTNYYAKNVATSKCTLGSRTGKVNTPRLISAWDVDLFYFCFTHSRMRFQKNLVPHH